MTANDYTPTPADFYVYEHRKATTGEVFYVGKGAGRRAWDANRRNPMWHRINKKYGHTVRILQAGLQEWAAFELEVEQIALHGYTNAGTGPLCNMTAGGDGTKGYKYTDEQLATVREKYRSPEWRAKMKVVAKKRQASGWYAKQSAAISAAVSVPIVCVSLGYEFCSATQAADWLRSAGIDIPASGHSNINAVLRGKTSTAYGLQWAYKSDVGSGHPPPEKAALDDITRHKRKRHMVKVKCDTTGDVFDSYVAAAKWLSEKTSKATAPNVVRHAATNGKKTRGAYEFSVIAAGGAA